MDVDDYHPAWALATDSTVVARAANALRAAGQSGETWLAPYCTNGSTSAGELGKTTVVYGAGEIADAHVWIVGVCRAVHGGAVGYYHLALGWPAREHSTDARGVEEISHERTRPVG